MADTLEVFGVEYNNVAGFKATDDNGDTLVYDRFADGDNLSYGQSDYPFAYIGSALVGTGRVV